MMVGYDDPDLPVKTQAELLNMSRSSLYYPAGAAFA